MFRAFCPSLWHFCSVFDFERGREKGQNAWVLVSLCTFAWCNNNTINWQSSHRSRLMEWTPSVWQMNAQNLEIITEIAFDGRANNSIAAPKVVALVLTTYDSHEMDGIFAEPIAICSAHSPVPFVCALRFAGLLRSIDLIGHSAQTNHSVLIQDALWPNRSSANTRQTNWIPSDHGHFLCYSSIWTETSRETERDRTENIAPPDPETKSSTKYCCLVFVLSLAFLPHSNPIYVLFAFGWHFGQSRRKKSSIIFICVNPIKRFYY